MGVDTTVSLFAKNGYKNKGSTKIKTVVIDICLLPSYEGRVVHDRVLLLLPTFCNYYKCHGDHVGV